MVTESGQCKNTVKIFDNVGSGCDDGGGVGQSGGANCYIYVFKNNWVSI